MGIQEFREYCEKHQNGNRLSQDSPNHRKICDTILNNPILIGLRGVSYRYQEVSLLEGKKKIGEIDMVLFDRNQEMYICEVKSGGKFRGAGRQLDREYNFIRTNFGVLPIRVYVRKKKGQDITGEVRMPAIRDVFSLLD